MFGPILYFDAAGNVVGSLDALVDRSPEGDAIGLVDFEAAELAGDRLRRFGAVGWTDSATGITTYAAGAATWPEWLAGGKLAEFRVELEPNPAPARARIRALVHRTSGYRRERAAIEAAIVAVEPDASGTRDIRHLVGGPTRPLQLDADGRTVGPDHPQASKGTPKP